MEAFASIYRSIQLMVCRDWVVHTSLDAYVALASLVRAPKDMVCRLLHCVYLKFLSTEIAMKYNRASTAATLSYHSSAVAVPVSQS
ncbi:hypothetical protein VTL71DRAFT_7098 [Oculimacula yallundae]|uniref:Uncharacterized protein n=1 Tax=Oculimacula yallundae TaxID=86028 RepID=A0ABR4BVQ8_9HELO